MDDALSAPLLPARPPAIPTLANAPTPEAVRVAAEEFEAMFLHEMLAPMFEPLDTEGLGGGGAGERMFRPMLVEHYAEAIAKAGGIGLADQVVRELNKLQEIPQGTQTEGGNGASR